MLQKQAFKFDSLRLWGEYDDICIFLDRESNYSNAQQGHQFRRVTVLAIHPQRFFYSREGESARQDRLRARLEDMSHGYRNLAVKGTVRLLDTNTNRVAITSRTPMDVRDPQIR